MLKDRRNMEVLKVDMVQFVDELFEAVLFFRIRRIVTWFDFAGPGNPVLFFGPDLSVGMCRIILLRMIYIRPHRLNPGAL